MSDRQPLGNLKDLTADQAFELGQQAFEREQYTVSITLFEWALARSYASSRRGGEIQLWLVNAHQSQGDCQAALTLCESLLLHPSPFTRQQAQNLLYILKAPVLQRPKEWLTEIPDLSQLADSQGRDRYVPAKTEADRLPKRKAVIEDIDLSQVNTQDNQFVWVALGMISLLCLSLWWWH
ncbi:MAG: hypothetical protein EA366_13150 [Spirulina sp. DLM2.Bin59]|nr:MAG: hypothetical protein EA366_13150 [Spirulina sp. DLM2.Bin59]